METGKENAQCKGNHGFDECNKNEETRNLCGIIVVLCGFKICVPHRTSVYDDDDDGGSHSFVYTYFQEDNNKYRKH